MPNPEHAPSARVARRMRDAFTFQLSVDTHDLAQGLAAAEAAVAANIDILEMGTPLLKAEGVTRVVSAFRERFSDALLLADMKTMDGGADEARLVYAGGANVVDFLALSGSATARAICAVRDEFRASDPDRPRLVFADLLLPHHGTPEAAARVALAMRDIGVDGISVHLQADARKADPDLFRSSYLADVARAVRAAVGDSLPVQVVGGLTVARACALAGEGVRALVISANLGAEDGAFRLGLPGEEIRAGIAAFTREVRGVGGPQKIM